MQIKGGRGAWISRDGAFLWVLSLSLQTRAKHRLVFTWPRFRADGAGQQITRQTVSHIQFYHLNVWSEKCDKQLGPQWIHCTFTTLITFKMWNYAPVVERHSQQSHTLINCKCTGGWLWLWEYLFAALKKSRARIFVKYDDVRFARPNGCLWDVLLPGSTAKPSEVLLIIYTWS